MKWLKPFTYFNFLLSFRSELVQLIPVDVPPLRDVSPADRSLRHYWGHLYRRRYNTGARYLEYIFNAFISGRAGTPEIAGRYLAVFQVLISSRSRCHTTQPPTPGGWGGRLHGCADSKLRPPHSPPRHCHLPPPAAASRWRRPCPPPPTAGSGVTSKTDL